jgi:hypothetical protein
MMDLGGRYEQILKKTVILDAARAWRNPVCHGWRMVSIYFDAWRCDVLPLLHRYSALDRGALSVRLDSSRQAASLNKKGRFAAARVGG